jgi:hypothetical protein
VAGWERPLAEQFHPLFWDGAEAAIVLVLDQIEQGEDPLLACEVALAMICDWANGQQTCLDLEERAIRVD